MEDTVVQNDIKEIAKSLTDVLPKLSGKTILITGGAGFLGRYILKLLNYINKENLEKPCKVIYIFLYIYLVAYITLYKSKITGFL